MFNKVLFLMLIKILLMFSNIYATTYFVAPSGNNSNPGTLNYPWETISKAANTLVANDTVLIRGGTYQEQISPVNSGYPGNYIVYLNYSGEVVTVDAATVSVPVWGGIFQIENKSYIKIIGLKFINSSGAGIIAESSSHIIIEKNYTYNTVSSGIAFWDGDNVIIDSNEVVLACNDGEQECITVAVTDTFFIRYNIVHHSGPGTNGGEGIDAKDGSRNGVICGNYIHHLNRLGIYIEAWDKHTYNIVVYQNIIQMANYGIVLASECSGLLEHIRVYNNIVYNNKFVGISISGQGDSTYNPIHYIYIINNTIFNNGWQSTGWGGGINIEQNPEVENIIIRNNICSKNLSFQIADESNVGLHLTVDHNLIDGYMGYTGEIYGNDSVVGDPLFIDTSIADFHLNQNSPAIDQGSSVDAPNVDFDGNPRPYGSAYDIGAYEYTETGVNEIPNKSYLDFFNISPNPFYDRTKITYSISESSHIELKIYSVSGQLVRTLVNQYQAKGSYEINWDAKDNNGMFILPGMYFYTINNKYFYKGIYINISQ